MHGLAAAFEAATTAATAADTTAATEAAAFDKLSRSKLPS